MSRAFSINWPVAVVVLGAIAAGLILFFNGYQLPAAVVQAITTGVVSLLPPVFAWIRQEVVSATTTVTTTKTTTASPSEPPIAGSSSTGTRA